MTAHDLHTALALLPRTARIEFEVGELLDAITSLHTPPPKKPEPERWLTAVECAALLNISDRWVYDHGNKLGARKLSRRCVRFSSTAVSRYLNRVSR